MFQMHELFVNAELDHRHERARHHFTDAAVARQNRRARRQQGRALRPSLKLRRRMATPNR
ncbi:MAG: hypothetical protein ACR2KG_06695 [Nocardioidaceae bacterium]